MRVRLEGVVEDGPAVDLRGRDIDVGPDAVARAVAGDPGGGGIAVDCPEPGPLHERAAVVRPGMALRPRTALAAAARTRGVGPDGDPDGDPGPTVDPGRVDLGEAKERAAEAAESVERRREAVARLQGRVRALREREGEDGDAVAAAEADLRDAVARLSEAETERAAAGERLERLRERRRAALDVRERRLAAVDRAENRTRERRRALVAAVREEFAAAVRTLGGPDEPFEADPVVAALACWQVAEADAPVVVAVDRLGDARAAHERLGVPVIRV